MLGTDTISRVASSRDKLDLRRGFHRELARELVERAEHLPEPERLLVERVFRDGRPITQVARSLAAPAGRADPTPSPRCMRRRVHRIVERLCSPQFRFVLEHRGRWGTTRRRVATACMIHGLTQREASEALGLSLHTVRRHFHAIAAMYEAASKGTTR